MKKLQVITGKGWMGLLALLCSVLIFLGAGPAGAANTAYWYGGNGLWSNAGSWLPANVVPDLVNNDYDVDITTYGSGCTVKVDTGVTIGNLLLGYGNTLSIVNGVWARAGDSTSTRTITNNGTISLDAYNSSVKLILDGNVILNGTGTLTMGAGYGQNGNYISGSSSYSLTNGTYHTISGTGYIGEGGLAIVNNGKIAATNSSSPLYVYAGYHGGVLTNNGILEALNGATLVLSSGTFNNNNVIQALNGSTVSLIESAIVKGGELISDATSKITGTNVTLDGITLTAGSVYQQVDGTTTNLAAGAITNNGTIVLNSYAGAERLTLLGDVTLAGTGTISMGAGYHYNSNYISASDASYTLTIGANQTIAGCGFIGSQTGFKILNYGTISANDSNAALYIYSGAIPGKLTNYGTLEAVDGGTLVLSSGTFDNTNGVIEASNGSTIALIEGATVTGGNLTSDSTSKITGTNVTLDGITLTSGSTYKQVDGTTTYLAAGTITNNGTIVLNSYAGAERLTLLGDVTLAGAGTISMGAGYHYNSNYISASSANYTLTIGENQTIAGCGFIGSQTGFKILNYGTISANDSNTALYIYSGAIPGKLTNYGTLEATDGGTLVLSSGTFDNTNGVIRATDGSTVALIEHATVKGGELTSDATSRITGSNVTLDGITLTSGSTYEQVNGTTTNLTAGTITNNGVIVLSAGSSSVRLAISGSVTLDGLGAVVLSNSTENYISGGSSDTLTVGKNQTISGSGQIGQGGLNIVNNGTIAATNSTPLYIHLSWTNGQLTNNGILEAAEGSTLSINGVLTNYSSTTKTLTGGSYYAAGTIQLASGYNISTNAATIVLSGANSKLLTGTADALANFSVNASAGTFKIKDGRDFTTAGDFSNEGHVNVGSGSTLTIGKDGSATYTQTSGTTKVNGTLIANIIAIKGGTLSGTGIIQGSLVNYGIINPGASPGTLTVTGDYSQDALATLLVELGGTEQGTEYDWLNISGNATLNGTLEVTLYGSYDLSDLTAGDTFVILTADKITGIFASVLYDDMDSALWKVIYGDTTVTLEYLGSGTPTPTPEPTAILLMVLGLAGLAGLRRRFQK